MLVGSAAGLLGGIAATKLIDVAIRPDAVLALVVGVPSEVPLATPPGGVVVDSLDKVDVGFLAGLVAG